VYASAPSIATARARQPAPSLRRTARSGAHAPGLRAMRQAVARCAGGSHSNHAAGGACCDECAEAEAAKSQLARAVEQRKAANHESPYRCEVADWFQPDPGPVVPAAEGAPACAAGNKASKATACIQPVVIADDDGKNPTTAPSMDKVKEIWKKCCIDYTIKPTETVKKTDYKTLDESPNNTPTAEETKLFTDAGASDCIQVFVPTEFAQGGKTGKDISGGGGTYDAGKAHPKIVVVEGTVPEVVAHEVGHASGHEGHDASDTVMKPTGAHDKANKTAVSAGVCTKARKGPVLTKGAADDCCQDPT
jgi:hypothetical protein